MVNIDFRGTGRPPHTFPVTLGPDPTSRSRSHEPSFVFDDAASAFRHAVPPCGQTSDIGESRETYASYVSVGGVPHAAELDRLINAMVAADDTTFDVLWHAFLTIAEDLVRGAAATFESIPPRWSDADASPEYMYDDFADAGMWAARAVEVAPTLALSRQTLTRLMLFIDGESHHADRYFERTPETVGAVVAIAATAMRLAAGPYSPAWHRMLDRHLREMELEWAEVDQSDWSSVYPCATRYRRQRSRRAARRTPWAGRYVMRETRSPAVLGAASS
jgi:hypothetical protein